MRWLVIVLLVLVSVTTAVQAADDGTGKTQPTATIQQLLSACASTDAAIRHEKCDRSFGSFFGAAVMSEMAPHQDSSDRICLPLTADVQRSLSIYTSDVLKWLHNHPEVQSLSEFDGLQRATLDLYKCPGKKK